jgi:replicative DNA helicase
MDSPKKIPEGGKKNLSQSGRNHREDLSSFVFGKVPPQAIPLEEAVLGALMLDKDAISVVLDILEPESFYLDGHQLIYKAMKRLFERSYPVDLLTVTEELKKSGHLEAVGGPYYLVELTNKVASSANLEYHARIISQKFIQREMIRVSTETIRNAYEDTTDVFDLLDDAEQGLFSIAEKSMRRSYDTMGSLAGKALKQIEALKDKKEGLTGVPTGFTNLDRITSGWQPSDLIIIAARPSMGKTAFVLSLARNTAADFKKPVAVFSLEMSSLQLAQRLIAMEAEIPISKLRSGKLEDGEWRKLKSAIEHVSEAPIFIDDSPGINIFEMRAKCRRMKLQYDIQLVIIDYLQLMSGGGDNQRGNREQEVSAISRALKGLAKELQVPVIALSQLSRAVEVRGGSKRPQLSDLRESGSIEQDADIVAFIYRPEYYQLMEDEQGQSNKGVAEIILAKHRNGATDTVKLRFSHEIARFSNADDPDFGDFPNDVFKFGLPGDGGGAGQNFITRPSRMNEEEDIPF